MISFIHTSYGYEGDCHELSSYKKVGPKNLVDYQGLLETLSNQPEITCVVIPQSIPGWQFSWKILTEHLRLSGIDNLSRVHVVVTTSDNEVDLLNSDVKKLAWSGGIWVHRVEDVPSLANYYDEPLSEEDLQELLPYIGNTHQNRGGPHDRANEWGPYRLLKCLADVSNKQAAYMGIEKHLLQNPFWRKKVVTAKGRELSTKTVQSLASRLISQLEIIHKLKLRVCVIEDELDKGWKSAYQFLFKTGQMHFFQSLEEFSYENLDAKYDIILLDLRISESAAMNSGDMLEIGELSGMKTLKNIRKEGNLLPIIMATASNKSWSYETAIQNGANGFWEKERPDLDLSTEYSYSNSNNLLESIVNVNSWYRRIEPILSSLNEIEESIIFPVVQRQVRKKRDTVIGHLFLEQTRFLKEYYGRSGEQTAFLSIWSIANDTRDYFLIKKDNQYVLRNMDWDVPYCSIKEERWRSEYSLSAKVLEYFDQNYPDINITPNGLHLDENTLIILAITLRSKNQNQAKIYLGLYFRLKTIRNHLSWIHGHSQLADTQDQAPEWKFDYIEHVCRLWHFVFVGASNAQ